MQVLKVLVVVMGVLIVAGVAVVVATLVSRNASAPLVATHATLDEPAGTRIGSATLSGRDLVVVLQGGGPDRVAVVDLRTGRRTGGVSLARQGE
jgi:hypothetical protein